ncbi:lantibiotic dehydratase family protein [Streptomyces sp. NPDC006333]|uniref:lantibiotic dehydratase family protein n=1 Tax=Streptomyces sp. NPDC006333 TaxID=3156753 RepID=UPI0033A88DA0
MTDDPPPVTYTSAGPALVRIPLAQIGSPHDGAGVATAPPTPEQLRARITALLSDDLLMDAVALASPSTTHTARQPLDQLPVKKLRTLAVSLTAYAARMRARATPFGLFAGVTLAPFADAGRGSVAEPAQHRRVVRPDAAWLRAVVNSTERSTAGLSTLEYAANPAVRRTDDTYVLLTPDARTSRIALRATATLVAAMEAAARQVPGQRILDAVRVQGASREDGVLLHRTLVTHGFLVSELQPPPHSHDPLAHVLDRLRRRRLCPELAQKLQEFVAIVDAYATAPAGAAGPALEDVHELADRVAEVAGVPAVEGSPLHVDTVVDADIAFGPDVRAEAEDAAGVLARFATARELRHVQDHLEQVSGGYAVPLPEFSCPPLPPRPPATHPALLAAYAAALHERRTEIVLDDALLDAIAPVRDGAPVTDLDLFAVVAAPDLAALNRGDFELHVRRPAASSAGTALARFAPALGGAGDKALRAIHDRADLTAADWLPEPVLIADVTFHPRHPAAENVARASLTRSVRIRTNTPADDDGIRQSDLGPQDLLLSPGPDGPQIWSRSLGVRVLPRAATALNSEAAGPHSAHVLAAASGQNLAIAFGWGTLADAPWLPRVRRGRTVFSPQTWRPQGDLVHDGARAPSWHGRFARWCRQWSVPPQVTLVDGDRQIPLRLDDPVDVHLLHRQAQKGPLVLTEALGQEHCWARSPGGAHLVEAVFPMAATERRCPGPGKPMAGLPPERPRPPAPVLPGGDWLRATLPCSGRRRQELRHQLSGILTGHRWFFTHRDEEHLDIRILLDPCGPGRWEELLAGLSDVWPAEGPIILAYPRDAGFGTPSPHPELLEHWAMADTRCALAALDSPVPDGPLLSILDLAGRLRLSGTRPLAGIEPDRRGFAPLRRRVIARLTGAADEDGFAPRELTHRWEERAATTQTYLRRLSAPAAVAHAGHLMVRQHAGRLVGPGGTDGLLALAAAAEHAHLSWHRATRDAS